MSEGRQFARMVRRAPRADVAILLITFTLTVLTDLVVAVNIGVILAMLQFLRRMSASVEVARQDAVDVERELGDAGAGPAARMPPGVLVYVIDGPFFFGAVEACERALVQTHTEPRVLLIRLGRVPFMDMTGLQTLEAVIVTLQKRGVAVVLAEANERVREKLARAGVLAALGEGNYGGFAGAGGAALQRAGRRGCRRGRSPALSYFFCRVLPAGLALVAYSTPCWARYSRISWRTTCDGVRSCEAHRVSKAFFLTGSIRW